MHGAVSLTRFYLRRAFRLAPALLFMLACVVPVGLVVHSPHIAKDALYALFYVGNWAQILGGYFPALGHTWSLAVEEHFYLVWPFAFIVAMRRGGTRAALTVVAVATAASFAVRVGLFDAGAAPVRLQYGTDARADAILVGVGAALLTAGRRQRLPGWASAIAWAVLAALLFVAPLGGLMLTVGFSAVAVCSAVIAVDAGSGRSVANRLLAAAPLVAVGRVSYGLYLWHYPVITLLEPRLDARLPHAVAVIAVTLVFCATTVFSYLVVERPALALKNRRFASDRRGEPAAAIAGLASPG